MPIVLKRVFTFDKNDMSNDEADVFQDIIIAFRTRMHDDMSELNFMDEGRQKYSDDRIIQFAKLALNDFNSETPSSKITICDFAYKFTNSLIVTGAIIFALISEGVFELRNQVSYSDGGLSINMFDKTNMYQGWASMMLQQYLQEKKTIKLTIRSGEPGAGFVGISSEFGYWGGY